MNLTACGVSLIGQFIGIDTPITIIQMLWVNIIMDTLGGLAFSGEPPLEYYMHEKPKSRNEAILSPKMLWQIVLCGAFTLGVCITFLTSPTVSLIYADKAHLYTAFYALFIFFGIFNCFVARCERMWILSNITKNIGFVLIMLAISLIQILMIYFGGELFRCVPLSARELTLVIFIAVSIIPFDIVRRIMIKLK
jgi:magnesium-transporting ATPase (P-type)